MIHSLDYPYLSSVSGGYTDEPATFRNFTFETDEKNKTIRVGLSAGAIHRILIDWSDNWPRRVGPALFVPDGDHGPLWLTTVPDLFAWIQSLYPPGNNAVQWADRAAGLLTRSEFHSYLRQQTPRYESVEAAPHEPPLANHYYIHPEVTGGDGKALAGLLKRFAPYGEDDAELIRAFFLTLLWGGPYGQRPGFLFTGPDADPEMGRGVGKTSIVRLGGRLVGGTFDIRPTDQWSDVIKRLLSNTDCSTQRVILIDNVKTHRFSWSDVEALITSDRINGRKMYVGDGARPNVFTVAITLNGASLSKDLAQRCVIVKLDRPEHSWNWEADTTAYIDANRWAIIGDLIAHLRKPVKPLTVFSRWGLWERDILGRLQEPERLQALITERRAEVDDDAEEADLIREAMVAELKLRGHAEADQAGVRIPAKTAAEIVGTALGERLSVTASGTKLKAIGGAIRELRKGVYNGRKVWIWQGKDHNGPVIDIYDPPPGHEHRGGWPR